MIQFPDLYCPCEPHLSPHFETIEKSTMEWAQQFNLLTSDAALERFKKGKFALLTARAFPVDNLEVLLPIADLNTWLFLFDDQCDETLEGKTAAHLHATTCLLVDVMINGVSLGADSTPPLVAGFSEVWQRLQKLGSNAWQQRFINRVKEYLKACTWEAQNREHGYNPTVEQYMVARVYNGAALIEVEAVEVMYNIQLPEEVMRHEVVQQLGWLAAKLICFSNDIFSIKKELENEEAHNLVLVIQRERNLTLQQALLEAADIHNSMMRMFETLEGWLPSFDAAIDYELQRYILGLRYWIRANFDWSLKDTRRYGLVHDETRDGYWSFK
jgi:Terpene synthase family 2, C-terminal metal binding